MDDLKYPVSNLPYSTNVEDDLCDFVRSNDSVSCENENFLIKILNK